MGEICRKLNFSNKFQSSSYKVLEKGNSQILIYDILRIES